MMKRIVALLGLSGFLLVYGFSAHAARADEPFPDTPTIRAATKTMLKSCKKEFPSEVPEMSINTVDHWAEAQERATPVISEPFKKTHCFAAHEAWEKLVQRNEWTAHAADKSERLPASASQKRIDGNTVPSWHGSNPIF